MKNEEIYSILKDLSEKIEIKVVEKNLLLPGLRAKSGLCIVEGQKMFIMDKNKKIKDKVDMLATCIGVIEKDLERIYIVPVVRDLILKAKQKYTHRQAGEKSIISYTFDEDSQDSD
ncbi:MAG: hypothetical protein KJ737_24240 [Proteobacteria bacterium]|nr:hypothetical protein [Pseudomonadota bacterium]